jgi:hypothetical protein
MIQKNSKYCYLTAKLLLVLVFVELPFENIYAKCVTIDGHEVCDVEPKAAPVVSETKAETSTEGPQTAAAQPAAAATPAGPIAGELGPNELANLTPDEALGMEYTETEIDNADAAYKKMVTKSQTTLAPAAGSPTFTTLYADANKNVDAMNKLAPLIKSCNIGAMNAADGCFEGKNSGIASAMSSLGQLAPTVGMMSMNDTCSAFSKIMTALNGAMAAYRAYCASHKAYAEGDCSEAMGKAATLRKATAKTIEAVRAKKIENIAPPDPKAAAAKIAIENSQLEIERAMEFETSRSNKYTPAYGLKITDGKGNLLANAGANILQVAGTMMSGQKCDKESAAPTTQADICKQYPDICAQQSPTPIADYCVSNPNDITCICSKNINDPACSGTKSIDPSNGGPGQVFNPADPNFSLDDASDLGPGFNPVGTNGLADGGNGANNFGGGGDGTNAGGAGAADGSSAGGSPGSRGGVGNLGSFGSGSDGGRGSGGRNGGIGGLGGGFGSGGSSVPGSGAGYAGSGFNTDISHEGGAGAGMGGAEGSRKPTAEELLKAFLPGGDKDPKKAGALDGITSAAGLTIFQKVTRGYQRNVKSLIPE